MLACFIVSIAPPVLAQDPSANQATLNFVNADIESVINAVGHYTGTTFIIDPRVKGTITLTSEKPVSKTQALDLLSAMLRLQGIALAKTGNFTKVVPEADAKLQATPTITTGTASGNQIATQIFRLNYESAANLLPALRPLISPNNTININPGNNTIIITDYADNLKRLGRIIASLDSPAAAGIDVVPIEHAVASDIAQLANRLLDQGVSAVPQQGGGGGDGRTIVLADSRTNSVIIRAPSEARANFAKALVAKLDLRTSQPGNVHVVYLRNADAVRLAQTLRAVVASDTAAQPNAQFGAQSQQPQLQQTSGPSGQPIGQNGQLGAGQLGSGQLQQSTTPTALPAGGTAGFIQADPATNALIITASETVYRNLRAVIDQLDARRAQVYVESLIVEVSSDRAAEFGVQWLGLSGDANSDYRVGGGTGFSTGGDNLINQAAVRVARSNNGATNAGFLPPGNGLSLGIFRQINGQLGLGALVRALENDSKANILSVPNLITLDNEEARIIVGQNVPFITGQYTTQASAGAAGVNPFQTIERRDIGLSLRVRPQVSEGGTIKLAIYQETSSIRDVSNTSGIITNKRSIESNVLVDDGQIIVLGGLMEDQTQDGEEKVPGFGDIPVLGNLFKYKSRQRTKTNLMVFLRPTVIRTAEQSVSVVNDRYEYIRGVQSGARPQPSFGLPDVDAPMLPPLQGGYPSGAPLLSVPRNENGSVTGAPKTPPVLTPDPGAPAQLPPQSPTQMPPQPPADSSSPPNLNRLQ